MKPSLRLTLAMATTLWLLTGCATIPPASGVTATAPASSREVIPGERVGPITATTTIEDLNAEFGNWGAVEIDYPIGEGQTVQATRVDPGGPRMAVIIWRPGVFPKRIDRVILEGQGWQVPPGLRPGDSLASVEKLNEAPFLVYGFEWDYGGVAYFKGGQLNNRAQIWFEPTTGTSTARQRVSGDQLFPSSDPALKAVAPRISKAAIVFP
jgi:hypothetical protein